MISLYAHDVDMGTIYYTCDAAQNRVIDGVGRSRRRVVLHTIMRRRLSSSRAHCVY